MNLVLDRPISTNSRLREEKPTPTAPESWRAEHMRPGRVREAKKSRNFALLLRHVTSARLWEKLAEPTSSTVSDWVESDPEAYVAFILPEPREKWRRLKQLHFPPEGREQRIRAAVRAIESAVAHYDLDAATMRWIAEDVDLEDQ